ncbi:MAG: hypothetical protein ACYC0V_15390 [Armatimonadota bacterium]
MHINASSKMILVSIVMLILFMVSLTTAFHESKNPPSLTMPDALIWISSTNPTSTYVSVTFPKVIAQTQAQTILANILKETGWTAYNIAINSDKPTDNSGNPMTSIEFMLNQSAVYQDGSLPIEPLLKALKEMKSIQILVMTSPGFAYNGVKSFENRYIKLNLMMGQNTYNFNINVKDSNFRDPGFPKTITDTENQQVIRPDRGWGSIALIFILAIVIATAVFLLMKMQQTKK